MKVFAVLLASQVTGPDSAASQQAPKALIVMAPSAGGKTTVVTKSPGCIDILQACSGGLLVFLVVKVGFISHVDLNCT